MVSIIDASQDADFPPANLPYGAFSRSGTEHGQRHLCTALGNLVVDVHELSQAGLLPMEDSTALLATTWNSFINLGNPAWIDLRQQLTRLLGGSYSRLQDDDALQERVFISMDEVTMHLPIDIGDYTDFYASKQHATHVGSMFRGKDNALQPNWVHLPVGYHGRASSIIISGQDVHRPRGQVLRPGEEVPVLVPCEALDFELEMACVVGRGNHLSEAIPIERAHEHIFGYVLMNDWSARDIQKWEYVPLGPFNGKNWATQISPWIVSPEALAPFRCDAPPQQPAVLSYLQEPDRHTYDVQLTVDIVPAGCSQGTTVTRSNLNQLYWTFPQMLSHHTCGGCNLRPGDLLGSGTISGDGPGEMGCLLEMTHGGAHEVLLAADSSTQEVDSAAEAPIKRRYLQDGDTVILRGVCQRGGLRIGFGECRGTVRPCRPLP